MNPAKSFYNQSNTSDILFKLIKEDYYKYYSYLYDPAFSQKPEDANLSQAFIEGGFNHPKFQIRAFIASNKNTLSPYLEQLAKDENWVVRKSVAVNPNTPESVLEQLAEDINPYVRLSLLDREDISDSLRSQLIEDLAKSENPYIRNLVKVHENNSTSIVISIARLLFSSRRPHPRLKMSPKNNITLTEAIADFQLKYDLPPIPKVIQLLENPKSPLPFPGQITLENHDCLHVLFDIGFSLADEAFIVGFTMGNDSQTKGVSCILLQNCPKAFLS